MAFGKKIKEITRSISIPIRYAAARDVFSGGTPKPCFTVYM
jgi:hypothetical protein